MVKQGYKQTEVGTIPVDWQVSTMESITSLMTNGFVGTIKSEYVPSGTGVLYLQGFNIKENGFDLTGVTYVSDSFHKKHLKSELKENDLLTVQTGDIGVTSCLPKRFEGANCQALIISRFYDKYDSRFWSYYFNSIGRKTLKLIETGTTMKHINVGDMKGILVPVPKTKDEQKRIAETLSDVDSMISTLEKLIAKKKAVKRGAMQELLTGKKRLPGFTGSIEYKPLSSLCTLFADGDWIESKDQSNDGIRLIQTGNIGVGKYLDKTNKQRFISTETFDRLKCLEIFENDVIVSRLPEPAGRACILPYSNKRRITAVDCTIIRFSDYNPKLFVAYSQTKQYQDKVDMAMAGSTRQRISRKELGEIPIPVFPTPKEQNAVASIFSDMDNEIEELEQKLKKNRQIKQGMMQQLLTGKIRLV